MQSFQDNSKFITMVNNRPSLSIIPQSNKRIIAQRWGSQATIGIAILGISSMICYKLFLDTSSLYVNKTRKAFNFEADPYTGTVKCSYSDVPNKQYGF